MNLQYRIDLLQRLGEYMRSQDDAWKEAQERASRENGWFTPEFVDTACLAIADNYLDTEKLRAWTETYPVPVVTSLPKKVGIVMAGNIPLVGFHDLLCVFITGHLAQVKPSSRDTVLITHLAGKLSEWARQDGEEVSIAFSEMLKNCDAYIATGSNNSAGHFEYYFRKYPHIIRRNRTSVAVLNGTETTEQLTRLADDVYQYFGLGCRNVTKVYVPQGYDFVPLLDAFRKYSALADHHKYKNNYDYNLAIQILNKQFYMSNESLLLIESPALFSPISQLNYEFYSDAQSVVKELLNNADVQCVVGAGGIDFGETQNPALSDYADGVDTVRFLLELSR